MVKKILCLLLLVYHVKGDCKQSPTTVTGPLAPKQICSGAVIFEDNFDNLDTNKWQYEQTLAGGGNNEFQWYSNDPKNSYVQNGLLHIKPTLLANEKGEDFLYSGTITIPADQCTVSWSNGCQRTGTADHILNPIKSARLHTVKSFGFKFGRVEIRAKNPAGDWLWPALWFMPQSNKYGNWPRSGEIDLMESRGNLQLNAWNKEIGAKQVGSTLHWGPTPALNQFMRTHYEKNSQEGFNTNFHKYQLEWTPDHIKFSVDDQEIGTVTPPPEGFWKLGELSGNNIWTNSKMAPFDQEFYIILNLAVGGTAGYFPDNAGGKPWSDKSGNAMTSFWKAKQQWLPTWKTNTEDSHLQVDYVRIRAL